MKNKQAFTLIELLYPAPISRIETLRDDQARGGFTLIELLVVVLIIGILAAVALPQYTLAVNKTRFANLRTSAHAIIKAAESYHLANGTWPDNFDELAVDILPGFSSSPTSYHTNCKQNGEMYCCISAGLAGNWSESVTCGRKDYSFMFDYRFPYNMAYCVAKENNDNAMKLCKSLGKTSGPWIHGMTPEGVKEGYRWRQLD